MTNRADKRPKINSKSIEVFKKFFDVFLKFIRIKSEFLEFNNLKQIAI